MGDEYADAEVGSSRGLFGGTVCAIGLVVSGGLGANGCSCRRRQSWSGCRVAVAPLGWDTNYTWLQSRQRSCSISGRPWSISLASTATPGAYIPELAEKWEMAPDGKTWTITLRKGVHSSTSTGDQFTARDVRHAVFLITQPSPCKLTGLLAEPYGDW